MRPERFEFVGAYRGPCARLRWNSHEVVCAASGTLLAMLRADVLGPNAKAEAKRLRDEAARVAASQPGQEEQG